MGGEARGGARDTLANAERVPGWPWGPRGAASQNGQSYGSRWSKPLAHKAAEKWEHMPQPSPHHPVEPPPLPQRKLASEGTAGSQAAPRAGAQKADRFTGISTKREACPPDPPTATDILQGPCSKGGTVGPPRTPGRHTGQWRDAGTGAAW